MILREVTSSNGIHVRLTEEWTTACLVDTDLGNPLLILYSKTDWACKA
ncbi:MAG: hypothetical protein KA146_09480 [Leptospiraceae bacterium]|nr:hypothetical protein [Leptospiraceae bacterium]